MKHAVVSVLFPFVLVGATVLLTPAKAHGQVEIELDPFAYIVNGYSGHIAYVATPVRASIGVFAADVPEFFHGNESWTLRSQGVTAKLDYVGPNSGGLFAGLDGGLQRVDYTLDAIGETVRHDLYALGVRTGYRFLFRNMGLYIVPWMSVSYAFNSEDIVIAGETLEQGPIQVFPTVHVGWRF